MNTDTDTEEPWSKYSVNYLKVSQYDIQRIVFQIFYLYSL